MMYRSVPCFSRYVVSQSGHVYIKANNKRMSESISSTGYPKMSLMDDNGKQKTVYVHRLVAEAFCYKPAYGEYEVNHINGDKEDNRAENLEWVEHNDNLKHAYDTGLSRQDLSARGVTATNMGTGEQMEFPSIHKAARFFGISKGNICECCKRIRPYANGYYWDYTDNKERSNEDA